MRGTAIRYLLPGLIALAAFGCDPGGAVLPDAREAARKDFDPDGAKEALIVALDAWKQGKARGLARRSPPIRFADDDLASGLRLADYELVEPDAPIEPLRDVPVILSLRDLRGLTVRRETSYQVASFPGLAVMRSEP